MTEVELRRLELRDLNAIEEIERSAYPTPWSRSMFASELAKPSSLCLGAFEPGTDRLIGYLIISRYVDAWHVMNVAVDPDHRRQGIASLLVARAMVRGHALGARFGSVTTQLWNAPAQATYARLGFTPQRIMVGRLLDQ